MDSVQRFDSTGRIKRIDVTVLRKTHPNVYAQIQMVPAMMLPTKQMIFGKAVFDYLLMPSRGILVSAAGGAGSGSTASPSFASAAASASPSSSSASGSAGDQGVLHQEEGVMAFNSAKGSFGDAFASIEENHSTPQNVNTNPHSHFNWTSIEDMMRLGNPDASKAGIATSAAGASSGMSPMNTLEQKMSGMNIETRGQKEVLDLDSLRLQRERDIQSLYAAQPMVSI